MKKFSAIALFVSAAISTSAFAGDSHDRYVGSVSNIKDSLVITNAKVAADIAKYASWDVKQNLAKIYAETGKLTAADIKNSGISDHHFYTGYLASAKNQDEYDRKLKELNGGANVDDKYVNNRDMKAHGSMLMNQVDGKMEVQTKVFNGHLTKVGEGFQTVGNAVQANIDNITAIGEGSEQRVATVDGHFEKVGTALNTQAGHIAQVGQAFESHASTVNGHLTQVGSALASQKDRTTAVIEGLKGLEGIEPGNPAQVEANRQNIAKIGDAVSNQYQAVNQNFLLHNGRITGLENTMEATTSSVDALTRTSNKLVVDMGEVRSGIAQNKSHLERVDDGMAKQKERTDAIIDGLKDLEVPDHSGDLTEIGNAVSNNAGNINKVGEALANRVEVTNGYFQQVDGAIKSQKDRTDAIIAGLKELENVEQPVIPDYTEDLTNIGSAIQTNSQNIASVGNAVQKRVEVTNGYFTQVGTAISNNNQAINDRLDKIVGGLTQLGDYVSNNVKIKLGEGQNVYQLTDKDGKPVDGLLGYDYTNAKGESMVGYKVIENDASFIDANGNEFKIPGAGENAGKLQAALDKEMTGKPTEGDVLPDRTPGFAEGEQSGSVVEENRQNIASMGEAFEQRVETVNDYLNQTGTAIKDLNGRFEAQAAQTAAEIARVDGRIDDLEKKTDKMKAGIAGANAIASLTQYTGNGTHHVAIGVGGYDGAAAFAGGYTHALDANTTIRATLSYDSEGEIGYGVSYGHSW